MNPIEKVCVYCASSRRADQEYAQSAKRFGEILGEQGITLILYFANRHALKDLMFVLKEYHVLIQEMKVELFQH